MLTFLYSTWDPSTGIPLGPFTLHYYSLMFIFAFGLGYYIMTKIYTIDNVNVKYVEPLFTWTLIGTILGARIGHVFEKIFGRYSYLFEQNLNLNLQGFLAWRVMALRLL